MTPGIIILTFLLPLLLAVVILAIGWRLWERPRHAKPLPWPPAVAIGLGFCLAFLLQEGWPSLPVNQGWHWLLPTTFAVTVLGAAHRAFPRQGVMRLAPELAVAFIAAFALQLPGQDGSLMNILLGIGALLATTAGRTAVIRRPAYVLPIIAWMLFGTLALLVLQTHSAKLSIISGSMSMIAAACLGIVLVRRPATIGTGTSLVIGFLVTAIAGCGLAYDQDHSVPVIAWCLPVLALPATAISRVIFPGDRRSSGLLISLGVAAGCCILALLLSFFLSSPAPATGDPDPYAFVHP